MPLAAAEFEILLLLVRNHGRVVEKKEIMAAVWNDVEVEENNLTVRMSSLRRALGEAKGYHPYIQTVTGRGYCFIVPVKKSTHEPRPPLRKRFQKLRSRIRQSRQSAVLVSLLERGEGRAGAGAEPGDRETDVHNSSALRGNTNREGHAYLIYLAGVDRPCILRVYA